MSGGVPMARATLAPLLLAIVVGCGGDPPADPVRQPAPEVDSLARSTPAEVREELELLKFEIADLAAYLEANPRRAFADSIDPREVLIAARGAVDGAGVELATGEASAAVDSLSVAAERIERVKRLLGVAEELGMEPEPQDSQRGSQP